MSDVFSRNPTGRKRLLGNADFGPIPCAAQPPFAAPEGNEDQYPWVKPTETDTGKQSSTNKGLNIPLLRSQGVSLLPFALCFLTCSLCSDGLYPGCDEPPSAKSTHFLPGRRPACKMYELQTPDSGIVELNRCRLHHEN